MYYVEFYDRRPGVPLADFHHIAATSFVEWSRRYPEDELVANIGRTWRLGPYPYVLVWGCTGIARLADWDAIFRSGAVADVEDPLLEAMSTTAAGFYRDVGRPLPRPGDGPFYLESFVPWDGGGDTFARRARAAAVELVLLIERVGLLAPDPGGIALYSLGSLADIERLQADVPPQVTSVGTYARVGEEIL